MGSFSRRSTSGNRNAHRTQSYPTFKPSFPASLFASQLEARKLKTNQKTLNSVREYLLSMRGNSVNLNNTVLRMKVRNGEVYGDVRYIRLQYSEANQSRLYYVFARADDKVVDIGNA